MKSKETESVASFFLMVIALFIGISFMYAFFFQNNADNEIETTTAKPIYQQQIGDEAEPDILIIYEAEVDGVKVYPSVIKEAK